MPHAERSMTARLVVFLECDSAGCLATYYVPDARAHATREAAQIDGWACTEVVDYCPVHAPQQDGHR